MSDDRISPNTLSAQALRVIAGEAKAAEFIQALRSGTKQPDDLAGLVAPMYGDTLRGFCRAIAKELETHHA